MFTGLVQAVGTVVTLETLEGGARLEVKSTLLNSARVNIGDSVCISGVCLTVVEKTAEGARFDLASETRRCTSLSRLKPGSNVNLETSLRVGDQLGGHFVFGHVDATGQVRQVTQEGETWVFRFDYPESLRGGYLVKKGSVAIDGVSLTVGDVDADSFAVYIIPHTFNHTTFQQLRQGDIVNLEIDMLARYVKGATENYLSYL